MLLYTQQQAKNEQMQTNAKKFKKSLDKLKSSAIISVNQAITNKCKQMQKSLKNRLTN